MILDNNKIYFRQQKKIFPRPVRTPSTEKNVDWPSR